VLRSTYASFAEDALITFTSRSPIATVLASDEARSLIERLAPEFLEAPLVRQLSEFPIAPIVSMVLGTQDGRVDEIIAGISRIPDPRPARIEEGPIPLRGDYEPAETERASAVVRLPASAAQNSTTDIKLLGPDHGNPFVDVDVSAEFRLGDRTAAVGGFYDGEGTYVLRFLPPVPGRWTFVTRSNAISLDGIEGSIGVQPSNRPGPVRVVDSFHFAFSNGQTYRPFGTTAYAWIHQPETLQRETLAALETSPFNKIRMCLFPKHFIYNSEEPSHFVWLPAVGGDWDTTQFDLTYWRELERRVQELDSIGLQADLILFHPYDRWSLSSQSRAADDRYVRYAARRLGGFPNVWWSLANEYELVLAKEPDDWNRIAGVIQAEDHVGHLLSTHNWSELWDYSSEWATHCSIQHGERLGPSVKEWRQRWEKPVILDECGYEGDLDQGWGNLTGEEFVQRCWEIVVNGGYPTHGETFYRDDEQIWWSKGGALIGDAPARIAFLQSIVAESPSGRLDPVAAPWDCSAGGVAGDYEVMYFGRSRPSFRDVELAAGLTAEIDVIDTWAMTIDTLPGPVSGAFRVPMPARPYCALRIRRVKGPRQDD
jgi:hypothetical protein